MAWSYRKRIKIIPGVHLNLSRKGISTSIGVRGASVTFGNNGTYLNTGIPGTGIYNRQRIAGGRSNNQVPNTNFHPDESLVDRTENIFSADIHEVTSQDMQGVKDAILTAQAQREELSHDLSKIKKQLNKSKFKLVFSYVLLYGLIKKTIAGNYKIDIANQKSAITQLIEQIDNCCVEVNIHIDPEIKERYDAVTESFTQLSKSNKIWDVTSSHFEDRRITRSAASTIITRKNARLGRKSLIDIRSEYEPLWIENANGNDFYIYPNFILMYASRKEFAIIGFKELDLYHSPSRFVERENVPNDSKILEYTWDKVNKNGSPDKRFKNNFRIPIVQYGRISLTTQTGVNEEYQISNNNASKQFVDAFKEYQQIISSLSNIN